MLQDRIGGMIFFVLSLAYGFSATHIPELPGEALDPLTPRTFPYALAGFGCFFSVLLVIKSGVSPKHRVLETVAEDSWRTYDWKLTVSLLGSMLAYGLLLAPLGFMLATWLFLLTGYYLMGERRPKVLLLASLPLVVGFWLLLTQVLGVYLESGTIWS